MPKQNPSATSGGGSPMAGRSVRVISGGSKPATPKDITAIRQAEANRTSATTNKIDKMKNAQNGNLESIKDGTLEWGNYKAEYKAATSSKGTQSGHAITDHSNHTRTVK
jgi:hypothetical protein